MKRCQELVRELEKISDSNLRFWRDPEYGPTKDDPHGYNSIVFDPAYPGAPFEDEVEWKRMSEIAGGVAFFLEDQIQSNDVRQGEVGNCWLIAAMSIVATQEDLVRGDFNPYAKMDKDKQITLDITDEEVYSK